MHYVYCLSVHRNHCQSYFFPALNSDSSDFKTSVLSEVSVVSEAESTFNSLFLITSQNRSNSWKYNLAFFFFL